METWTTAEAAAHCGITPSSLRSYMQQLRGRGVDYRVPREYWPDLRTPLYQAEAIREWHRSRRTYTRRESA